MMTKINGSNLTELQNKWKDLFWQSVKEEREAEGYRNTAVEINELLAEVLDLESLAEKTAIKKESKNEYKNIKATEFLVPRDAGKIGNFAEAAKIGLLPGRKVIMTKDKSDMTLVAMAINLKLLIALDKTGMELNKGTATGGTTTEARMWWGLLPYLLDNLENHRGFGQFLEVVEIEAEELKTALGHLNKLATLDDYGWTKTEFSRAEREIGPISQMPFTYRAEQWNFWKYLFKDENRFVSPPIGEENLETAIKKFHEQLEKMVIFGQDWGVGCDGHGGFNEPG
ncbi:MAG: hypothetical protein WC686_00770, partial [Candidatus Shapirobacteria bacterium]